MEKIVQKRIKGVYDSFCFKINCLSEDTLIIIVELLLELPPPDEAFNSACDDVVRALTNIGKSCVRIFLKT